MRLRRYNQEQTSTFVIACFILNR